MRGYSVTFADGDSFAHRNTYGYGFANCNADLDPGESNPSADHPDPNTNCIAHCDSQPKSDSALKGN
jgi:hypothetical protein